MQDDLHKEKTLFLFCNLGVQKQTFYDILIQIQKEKGEGL